MRLAAACFALLALTSAAHASGTPLGLRQPGLSPDGSHVAFTYWGDIWTVPVDGSAAAVRLTDHLAYDSYPRYSPDGASIAFNSDRSGGTDIWVIPAWGGSAQQVTSFSGGDTLCGWTADGRIAFNSRRDLWADDLYVVDAAGADPPQRLTRGDHYNSAQATHLPGDRWVYARGNGRWWRKGYRGTSQTDLWQLGPEGTRTRLTSFAGMDQWPMAAPDGSAVYYVSDESGVNNIWRLELASGAQTQLTSHADEPVLFPGISADGRWIAYEQGGGLWRVSTAGGTPELLNIALAGESKDNWTSKAQFSNESAEFAVAPSGKYVVFGNNGELWGVRDPKAWEDDERPDQDVSEAWRLTTSDDARDRMPAFAPDNRHVAFACDADGDYEVFVLDLLDGTVEKLTDNAVDDLEPQFDPASSDLLYYYSGNRSIMRHDLKAGTAAPVADGRFRGGFGYNGFSVSPDGRWVAYTEEMTDWSAEVFIVPATGGDAVNITRHPESESNPRWSADGRRLSYSSSRNDGVVLVVDLDPEPDKYVTKFLTEDDLKDKADKKKEDDAEKDDDSNAEDDEDSSDDSDTAEDDEDSEKDSKDDKKDEKVEVKIDFDDIDIRARQVSTQRSAGGALLSADGEYAIYTCNPDGKGAQVWSVKIEGGDAKKVRDGGWSGASFADSGKRIYFQDGGTLKYLKYDKGGGSGEESVTAHGQFWLDRRARWRQMFREGWRTLREQFYDADMHGADWDAVYAKYSPYMDSIGTPEEFGTVFSQVLGELNASHLGITMASKSFDFSGQETSHLGLEFEDGMSGAGLKVSHITYQGPADLPGIDIKVGDILHKVDGHEVGCDLCWETALNDRSGRPVTLTLAAREGTGTREVVLKPISYGAYQGLLYREWEIANEQRVDELSGGRIGYIHIRSMSRGELEKFEREFFSRVFDRDALIVDVRFNPGGWIHEDLFELLDRGSFGYSAHRDADRVQQPPRAFNKPKALLINASSGSDAEIFPTGWRQLKLGPVIGIDTAGAVIGTTGFTLVDGTWVRLPLEGWYDLEGRNLEKSGTPPDIYVDVDPNELESGRDAQLERAVEELLKELSA